MVTPVGWPFKWPLALLICVFCLCEYSLSASGATVTSRDCTVALNDLNMCVCSLPLRSCYRPSCNVAMSAFCLSVSVFISALLICCRSQCEYSPIFCCNAPTTHVSLRPILYKCVILFVLDQWRFVLPGNTVLKMFSNYINIVSTH